MKVERILLKSKRDRVNWISWQEGVKRSTGVLKAADRSKIFQNSQIKQKLPDQRCQQHCLFKEALITDWIQFPANSWEALTNREDPIYCLGTHQHKIIPLHKTRPQSSLWVLSSWNPVPLHVYEWFCPPNAARILHSVSSNGLDEYSSIEVMESP